MGLQATVGQLTIICNTLDRRFNFPADTPSIKSEDFSRKCGASYDQILKLMDNIEDFNIHQFYSHSSRTKRAPFNFVGNILSSLFGTLSQEDAENYITQFNDLERQAAESVMVQDDLTTLITATAQAMKQVHEDNLDFRRKTEKQIEVLNVTMFRLSNNFDNLWLNLEVQFQLTNLLTFISLSITAFHEKQKRFLEALSIGVHGGSHTPMILPPAVFLQELTKIRNAFAGKDLDLPLPIDKDTLTSFYQIADTRSRIVDEQLIVQMSIPIVSTQEFELNKLTSFPFHLQGNTYSFIIPSPEYVALDTLREKFITLTQKELDNCHNFGGNVQHSELICMQLSPVMSTISDDCSVSLVTQDHHPQHCDVRISNISSETWIRLQKMNSWIAVFPQKQLIYVKCNNFPTFERQIEGTGIVLLGEDCQIKTNHILIQAQKSYNSSLYSREQPTIYYSSDFNNTLQKLNQSSSLEIKKLDYPSVISLGESAKLAKLSSSLDDLLTIHDRKRQFVVYKQAHKQSDYWTTFFFILLIVTSYILIVFAISYCNQFREDYRNSHSHSYRPNTELVNIAPPTETNI